MKVLVTGSNGQLGSELQRLAAANEDIQFIFTTRATLPLTDSEAMERFFETEKPEFCVNCAAYTAVDKAESDEAAAMAANADAPGELARLCAQYRSQLIHISTDYVFNGSASAPIVEDAPVQPLGVYGRSKAEGEKMVLRSDPTAIIIRTSWVYSSFGNNFVKTMLRLMSQKDSINVVSDQFGSPTFAYDLAKVIITIIRATGSGTSDKAGIYHYSNEGEISWYDFAVAIREMSGLKCTVQPIPTTEYPTPARRPAYSVFSKEKIRQTFSVDVPYWRDSLRLCLTEILRDLAV